jgi:putative sigma-54 modulation protein
MRIEVHGRNVEVTDELREAITKRFVRVGEQVADQAMLDVELREEKNPRISDRMVAAATLRLKGVTVRASEASPDMLHSIHELAEDVRRQVKKHREKRRGRERTRRMIARMRRRPA